MNNSVYGKTMENVSKRVKVTIVYNARDYKNGSVGQISFHRRYLVKILLLLMELISAESLCSAELKYWNVVLMDKPIYVGFSILDLSKLLMYDFHYNYIKAGYDC